MTRKSMGIIARVPWRSHIDQLRWDLIDMAVIGNPFCPTSPDGLRSGKAILEESLTILEPNLKKAVFALPIAPLNRDLPLINDLLEKLSREETGGVEVQSHAMACYVHNSYPHLPIYFGSFSNVHTIQCAGHMEASAVAGGCLPFELDCREYLDILRGSSMAIILSVLGRFPVALSRGCYFHQPGQGNTNCSGQCMENQVVDFGQGRQVIHRGRALFSRRYLNLLEYLPALVDLGFSRFQIEGLLWDYEEINRGIIIIQKLLEATHTEEFNKIQEEIESLTSGEHCNGFFFGGRGMEYYPPERGKKILDELRKSEH